MSILILGMEMPQGREINLRIDEKGEVYVYGSYPTELHKAVPVPPHGRLIDADALKIEVFAHDKLMKDGWNNMDMGMFTGDLIEVVDGATTIIPASGGKEDE